jgi:hypothetical protein
MSLQLVDHKTKRNLHESQHCSSQIQLRIAIRHFAEPGNRGSAFVQAGVLPLWFFQWCITDDEDRNFIEVAILREPPAPGIVSSYQR